MEQSFYLIALSFLPNIGANKAKNLISYCGSAQAVFEQKKSHLLKIPGVGQQITQNIISQKTQALAKAEAEMAFMEKHQIKALTFLDKDYPQRLAHCVDAPLLLFQKGNTNLNQTKILSIVGTRKATHYGKSFVKDLLSGLATENILVVSGMALGIDGQAHLSAVENNVETVGVLGHGLNQFYPEQNKATARKMLAQNGALLTEFNSQEKFLPANFPKRNRIIAGMADATIVVESEIKGGSMITANIANTYNRDVFALPGRRKDRYSIGCNFLLKTYKANIVESAKDLLNHMRWNEEGKAKQKTIQKELFIDLNPKEEKIVAVLKDEDALSADVLCQRTKLSSSQVATSLLELELKGVIDSLPGNLYTLN